MSDKDQHEKGGAAPAATPLASQLDEDELILIKDGQSIGLDGGLPQAEEPGLAPAADQSRQAELPALEEPLAASQNAASQNADNADNADDSYYDYDDLDEPIGWTQRVVILLVIIAVIVLAVFLIKYWFFS